MDIILIVIASACAIIGLLGVIVPVLPGTILSLVGLICVYFTSTSSIGLATLIFWGVIAVAAVVMDYVLPGYFSKMFGGTKAGITGATIGTFAGVFLGVPGIILGPFFGAIIGEMVNGILPFRDAVKVGFGSLMSFIVGTGLKLIVAVMIVFYVIRDIVTLVAGMV